jgi:phosphatidylserine decarboxylase
MTRAAETPRLRDRAFVAVQHLLPQHALSRIVWHATRSTRPAFKDFLIRSFLSRFDVNMDEALESNPFAYPSFNAFFTRALKPSVRPQPPDPAVVSPVDGTVSQIGSIDGDRLIQAKGHDFTLGALLAGDAELVPVFHRGEFATIYLAPYNYHRIHMPLDGRLTGTTHVPGRLFSVNTATAAAVPDLFARNERVTCLFETSLGRMAVVLVGALFVGSMATVWAGDVTPARRRAPTRLDLPATPPRLERGGELGRFNMGSTVIVLFEAGRVRWRPELAAGVTVRVGQPIGTLRVGN